MDSIMERKPITRRKKKFFVEENVDAIQWPQECAVCGKPVENYDDNEFISNKFKNLTGAIIPKVPYCHTCYSKVKATRRLDMSINILAFVIGIPLGIFLAYDYGKTEPLLSKTTWVCMGIVFIIVLFFMIKLLQLLIRLPIKFIFKNRYTDCVEFDDKLREQIDKRPGRILVITIPNKLYADKFAILNSAVP
jgi:hypothetical protein